MPTESIREQAKQKVIEQLAKIRVADGYWYDIRDRNVTRHIKSIQEAKGGDMPLLMVVSGDGQIGNHHNYRHDEEDFQIYIRGYTKAEDADDTGTAMERLLQDVRKVLLANVELDGVVRTTRIRSVETDEGSLAYELHAAFQLTIAVEYVHAWTQP